jgi:hypothetical protein
MEMQRIYRGVVVRPDGSGFDGEYSDDGDNWYRFGANLELFVIKLVYNLGGEAAERLWAIQDGYGYPGLTPPQGYDWSGIRDSSPPAIELMCQIAREYVTADQVNVMLGAEVF